MIKFLIYNMIQILMLCNFMLFSSISSFLAGMLVKKTLLNDHQGRGQGDERPNHPTQNRGPKSDVSPLPWSHIYN